MSAVDVKPTPVVTPFWRAATAEEAADHLAGENVYNDAGWPYEIRETTEGIAVLEGTPIDCGCIPHVTRMSPFGGIYCDTENQPMWCNFECPHDGEE